MYFVLTVVVGVGGSDKSMLGCHPLGLDCCGDGWGRRDVEQLEQQSTWLCVLVHVLRCCRVVSLCVCCVLRGEFDGNATSRILLFGRSIGTGPVLSLASQYKTGGVILVTPFLSVKTLFREKVWTDCTCFSLAQVLQCSEPFE